MARWPAHHCSLLTRGAWVVGGLAGLAGRGCWPWRPPLFARPCPGGGGADGAATNMLVILSPAKTLDMSPVASAMLRTQPALVAKADALIRDLRKYSGTSGGGKGRGDAPHF
jgi:hypothetical protein